MASPTSPFSLPSGDSHPRDSSGASSGGPSIDNSDMYRISGPTSAPPWPAKLGPPSQEHSKNLWDTLMELASKHISEHGVESEAIIPCQRWTDGESPLLIDDTLYIKSTSTPNNAQWFSVAEKLVGVAMELGFKGRIEIIYTKAEGGMKSYPPRFSNQQRQRWHDIELVVFEHLSRAKIPWNVIMPANRGYWEDISRLTMVVKTLKFVPRAILGGIEREIVKEVAHHNVSIEIGRSVQLWGVFADSKPPEATLGWPFTHSYNSMGLSLSRFSGHGAGTLGGYLEIIDQSGRKHTLGITCYHVVRKGPSGELDSDIQSSGTITADYPCQSPSMDDIASASAESKSLADTPLPPNVHPIFQQQAMALREKGQRLLKEIASFDPRIGSAVALSGYRNMELPGDPSTMLLLDWAAVEVRNAKDSLNDILTIPNSLGPNLSQYWSATNPEVPGIGPLPPSDTVLFKRGRTTGVTMGTLGAIMPASCRTQDMPATLHHRAYVVYGKFGHIFGDRGDSGAWCLNGNGEVVGLLIAGCAAEGYGMMLPMNLVVQDIERLCNCGVGSLRLKMA